MKEVLETLQALYRDSPSSALAVDREMNILWANPAALSCYPVLSLPGGLSLLFSEAQLSEVSSAEGAHTIELAGITRIGFCFAPLEGEGYLVTIGVLADDLHDAGGRPADFLAATITNQLNTPLSNIFTSLFAMAHLPETEPGGRLSELIEQMNRSSYQMLRFSMDFNAYLQDTLGKRPFCPEMLDLGALLTQLGEAARMLTQTIGIPMDLILPEEPVYIRADERRLSHALLHMISNSCRFTREGNRIEILLEKGENQARLSISDRGLGIPREVLDRVCEPFFSHDPDGMPYAGSGLGLAVARHVISQHGGSFAITSREGEGTTVAVGLPLLSPGRLLLKSPEPVLDLLRDRFSLVHVILSDSCGVPKL